MLKTQTRTFHLHIDATYMPDSLHDEAMRLGFWDSEFSGHPEGYSHFEPNHHVTMKFNDGRRFREACAELESLVARFPDFVGYFEGEYIREERLVEKLPYSDAPVPFRIKRRRLDGSQFERFRESELHLTLDRDTSDPNLIHRLLEAGLYGAYLPKADYTALVLTIQGFREDVGKLTEVLWEFLARNGGATKAKLKEEYAVWHRLYGVEPRDLPEIIDTIEYVG